MFGVRLTNSVIERTVASIFTGGVHVKNVGDAAKILDEKKIGCIPCYVVEGLRKVENKTLDDFEKFIVKAI